MEYIIGFLKENQEYTKDVSDFFQNKLSEELEYYLDYFDYGYGVESRCNPYLHYEVQESDYTFIIEEIKKEIEDLMEHIPDEAIKSNTMNRFKSFENNIKFNIDTMFEELVKDSRYSNEENLPNSIIDVDDILDRPI